MIAGLTLRQRLLYTQFQNSVTHSTSKIDKRKLARENSKKNDDGMASGVDNY